MKTLVCTLSDFSIANTCCENVKIAKVTMIIMAASFLCRMPFLVSKIVLYRKMANLVKLKNYAFSK